jgi:hypothetical protein
MQPYTGAEVQIHTFLIGTRRKSVVNFRHRPLYPSKDRRNTWRQASAEMLMRSALFWDITQRRVVILYRRFGTTYRPHFKGQDVRPLKWGLKFLPTSTPQPWVLPLRKHTASNARRGSHGGNYDNSLTFQVYTRLHGAISQKTIPRRFRFIPDYTVPYPRRQTIPWRFRFISDYTVPYPRRRTSSHRVSTTVTRLLVSTETADVWELSGTHKHNVWAERGIFTLNQAVTNALTRSV